MKELAAVSHLFLSYTAHFWTRLVMRNRLVHCWLHNPSRSAEVSASWSGPVFRAALSLSPRWSRSSPQLAHSLPLSSSPLSTKVQGCLTPTPRFLYSTSSWFSCSPHCHCVFVVAALVPIPSSLIQAFFFSNWLLYHFTFLPVLPQFFPRLTLFWMLIS